jgi:succinoglycan biosynthesis protein ExoM
MSARRACREARRGAADEGAAGAGAISGVVAVEAVAARPEHTVPEANVVAVDVCVATYRRPHLLATLIGTLAAQTAIRDGEGVRMRLVVVDNHADGTARGVVEGLAGVVPFPIVYSVEPRKNIAHARNAALQQAGSAEWAAFLDDDEGAAPDWLHNLLQAARTFRAEVVFGPVLSVLPAEAPDWISRGRFFDFRRRYPTGTPRATGGFGNVLISQALLQRAGRSVDPAYGLTGGEDTEFFLFLGCRCGARMIWCDEAVATELIAPHRLTLGWLVRRHWRSGQITVRLKLSDLSMLQKSALLVKRSVFAATAALGVPLLWPLRRQWGVHCVLKAVSNAGQVSALFGGRYMEYGG